MKIKSIYLAVMLSTLSVTSQAQEFTGLVEGKDYTKSKISNTVVPSNQSKPTFVEFFWYGCTHCYQIKDEAARIAKKYSGKVNYMKYPVGFPNWESGGKIYFALEEMNLIDKLHDKTFEQIHKNRVNILMDKSKRDSFFTSNGVDIKKFNETYDSFSVNNKWTKAKGIVQSHKIDGSPILAVYSGGYTYQISPAQAGGYSQAINNLDKILAEKIK